MSASTIATEAAATAATTVAAAAAIAAAAACFSKKNPSTPQGKMPHDFIEEVFRAQIMKL